MSATPRWDGSLLEQQFAGFPASEIKVVDGRCWCAVTAAARTRGELPAFDDLMNQIQALESEINALGTV